MTDLPQLQALLVDAAVKRRRFRRLRRAGAGFVVAAAVAAAVLGMDTAPDDRAVPAVPPAPTRVSSVEDAFGPFGDPVGVAVPGLRQSDRVRRVGHPETAHADSYLVLRGDRLCLAVRTAFECRAAAGLVSGHEILASRVDNRMYAVLPHGVKTVRREWTGYEPASFAVMRNLVVFTAPSGRGRLDWRAPDGTAAHVAFAGTTLEDAATYYRVLGRGDQPGDRVNGLPGRWLGSFGDFDAWMIPRRNAVCLVVRLGQRRNSGCRRPVANTAVPLVVAVGGYAAIALPNGSEVLSPPPPGGVTTNTMLLARGAARTFRYRSPYGDEETVTLPARADYVVNGFEKRPEDLPRR